MRTHEQITNIRTVFSRMFGPFAFMMSDEDVDHLANTFQDRMDHELGRHYWSLKVRMEENKDLPWDKIDYEPHDKYCYLNELIHRCEDLIEKYPKIIEIRISGTEIYQEGRIVKNEKYAELHPSS